MGSKHKQTRQLQKERFEKLLAQRRAYLLEQHIPLQKQVKDKVLRRLQAKINQLTRALVSIQALETSLEKAATAKQNNIERKKDVKMKSKQRKTEPAPEKATPQEKKKKKSDKT